MTSTLEWMSQRKICMYLTRKSFWKTTKSERDMSREPNYINRITNQKCFAWNGIRTRSPWNFHKGVSWMCNSVRLHVYFERLKSNLKKTGEFAFTNWWLQRVALFIGFWSFAEFLVTAQKREALSRHYCGWRADGTSLKFLRAVSFEP